MQGLPALIERLAFDRGIVGRPDLLAGNDDVGLPDPATLAARLSAGIDFTPEAGSDGTRLPAGARLGRIAFSPVLQTALAAGDAMVPPGLFRLPDTREALVVFFTECTGLGGGNESAAPASKVEAALQRFYGLSIRNVAEDCLTVRAWDETTYTLLMSREFDLALVRMPALADPHPHYPRLARGLLDALLILAELERLRDVVASLAGALAGGVPGAAGRPPTSRDLVCALLGEPTPTSLDDATIDSILADTPFHVETMVWLATEGPKTIDFADGLLAMLAGRQDLYAARHFPEGRKRLGGMLKEARATRPNSAGKTMPIALPRYMGLDLLDTTTVGLIEIASGTLPLGNDRADKDIRLHRAGAFWTLLITLLTDVAPHVVPDVERQSLRGRVRTVGQDADPIDKGEARLRRASEAGGLIEVYLPPAGTPVGVARFVPQHWLRRDRHQEWSRRIVQDFRGGTLRGMIDALPAQWRPSILERISTLRRILQGIEEQVSVSGDFDDALAAATLAALLPAMTPLTSDPLLHFVLQRHRKIGSGAWLDDRVAALHAVRAEQDADRDPKVDGSQV